ncbi:MAG: magnesium/cobalt transporter CorA [Fimbriimonadaceae bacterium]|nr:magnesium/cobalt transporter CorA [Fimbriimonadaceae bacterium]
MGDPQPSVSLAPGTAVYTGRTATGDVTVWAADYDAESFEQLELDQVEDCQRFLDSAAPTWLRVDGLHNVAVVERLGELFGLHPLVVEDIVNVQQRPKLDDYGSYLFLVFRLARRTPDGVRFEQVAVVLGGSWLLSFQESTTSDFGQLQEHLEAGRPRIRTLGLDYLAYRLLDVAVDQYFGVLETVGDRIEELEDQLLARFDPHLLNEVQALKRDLIAMRRSVWPLREVVAQLDRGDSDLVRPATRLYLKDLHDHTIQVVEMIETEIELLGGLHDLYLSLVSNRTNEAMKVLAMIATVFMPMSFIAGVYGMNFQNMPELGWRYGYYGALTIMGGLALSMVLWFRRRGW